LEDEYKSPREIMESRFKSVSNYLQSYNDGELSESKVITRMIQAAAISLTTKTLRDAGSMLIEEGDLTGIYYIAGYKMLMSYKEEYTDDDVKYAYNRLMSYISAEIRSITRFDKRHLYIDPVDLEAYMPVAAVFFAGELAQVEDM